MSAHGGFLHRAAVRLSRILTGKAGIYGKIGRANHFAQGVLVYEAAEIGHDNYFAPYTLVNNCRIGNFCSIGPGCRLGLGEHDMTAVSTCPRIANGAGGMELFSAQTVIEHDVWLGANVVVRQGVHIGTGAVVGSGAVVTKDIPPYAVAAGVPARVLRYRFSPGQIEALLASQWFLKENAEAKQEAARLRSLFDTKQEEGT